MRPGAGDGALHRSGRAAGAKHRAINRYIDERNELPRIILLQNHGLIVLGKTSQQVEDTTAMAVKAARILLGTYAARGPHFLSEKDVARIHTRPDELYWRQKLGV